MDVAAQCENLGKTEKGGKPLVLKDKTYAALHTFSWLKVVEEGHRRSPDVIENGESRIPAIGLAYAVMMHQSYQQLSLVQRIKTLVLFHGHAEKMVSFFSHLKNIQCLGHVSCYSAPLSEKSVLG